MKKKALTLMLAATTTLTFALAGCGVSTTGTADTAQAPESTENTPAADTAATTEAKADSAEGTTVRLVNNKAEIQEGLTKLADTYKEQTGVTIDIETIGGGQDTQAILKNYYQADDMPDIFVFEGDTHYETWKDLLVDLTDEEWTKNTEAEYVAADGHVYGFPTTTEAIGLSYNKSILDKAGIDPKSITGPESMRAAFEKIDSMKDELGLTAVIGYYTESANLWWTAGQHLFGTYLDSGLKRDDTTYLDLINDGGKLDPERAKAFAEMVALFNEYTDPKGISGSYDDQVLGFASGQYAFVSQGSWIGASMTTTYADQYAAAGNFEVGMIPYAFIEGQDTIQTNSPNWWGLYNGGNVDAAKAFIQWCSQNDGGQEILAKDCGCVSPFTTSEFAPDDPFAATIGDYTAAGKTSAWHWQGWKAGLAQNVTSVIFQDFAKGSIKDTDQFVDTLQKAIEAYYAQQ
ncbi:MAG: carbohydrate ABC transporter substrate-binding protein [Butyrivibrio sp.]|uniref:ABC transporter substrate-binding protein n=1 Tax=Butyrivibrio sp. TaxID=28121 RepID=UPI001B64B361|nr:ABC transporter substrate-binding protein [Butyrivibrio sp.]MBP3783345.1 carbohydrate ABC transporter substrate-binding protein [Butyrivibrio sp.]